MNRPYSVLEGKVVELSVGYRFCPTEVELFEGYLLPKMKGEALPCNSILDLDVYQFDPQQLPLNHFKYATENEAYFFMLEDSVGERMTPNGYWKISKKNVPFFRANKTIGFKNELQFFGRTFSNSYKTNWRMVEYIYNPSIIPTRNMEKYIACKVWQKIK